MDMRSSSCAVRSTFAVRFGIAVRVEFMARQVPSQAGNRMKQVNCSFSFCVLTRFCRLLATVSIKASETPHKLHTLA